MSNLEDILALHIRAKRMPPPKREWIAVPGRKFRFDFAWPDLMLLVEVQGGIWTKGGHSTGVGISRDCEKGNLATLLGWRVLHVTSEQIKAGKAIQWIEQAMKR